MTTKRDALDNILAVRKKRTSLLQELKETTPQLEKQIRSLIEDMDQLIRLEENIKKLKRGFLTRKIEEAMSKIIPRIKSKSKAMGIVIPLK